MFLGRHLRQLDGKGRLAIPAEYLNRFAPEERGELVVAPGRGCIWLVPKGYWDREFEALARQYSSEIQDEFYHHCQLRPVDKAGRLLIDEEARELAGLGDPTAPEKVSVVVCGSGRYLQVWEKGAYDRRSTSARDFARALPAAAAGGEG